MTKLNKSKQVSLIEAGHLGRFNLLIDVLSDLGCV